MARYRKIDVRFWSDEKIRDLSDQGKLAVLYILTHPSLTCVGAMRASIPGLAAELGWSEADFREAIDLPRNRGLLEINEKALFIGLPNFLRYNEPEGPNSVVKAWPAALSLIPECLEKARLIVRCRAYLENRSTEFKKALTDGVWKALPMPSGMPPTMPLGMVSDIQEPETGKGIKEQEEEGRPSSPSDSPVVTAPTLPLPIERPEIGFHPTNGNAMELARLLADSIVTNTPNANRPSEAQVKKWAEDIEKCHRLDGHSWDAILELLKWSQANSFWSTNVQSGKTFREKWNRLQSEKARVKPSNGKESGKVRPEPGKYSRYG